jgi:hypothetical protein
MNTRHFGALCVCAPLALAVTAFTQSEPIVALRSNIADAGLCPEALAASGCHSATQGILDTLVAADEHAVALAQKRQQLLEASTSVRDLAAALSLDPESEQLQTQYASALAQQATILQQIAQAQGDLRDLVGEELSPEQAAQLVVWRGSEGRSVPPQFRVAERSGAEWDAIEHALIAERRAQRLGETLAAEHAAVLADVRGEVEVIAAANSLELNLPAVQTAFEQQVDAME